MVSKTQIADFIISKFQILKKALKGAKTLKNQRKKTSNFFCVCAFIREEKIPMIKSACFMLNFLNLKSKASHLFWGVASSLSILWNEFTRNIHHVLLLLC